MKKSLKIFAVIAIVLALVLGIVGIVSAKVEPGTVLTTVDNNASDNAAVSKVGGQIVGIIQTVGIVIAVVMLLVVGIKYMMGSAEEKAQYKQTLLPYVIGAVLIFAASTLVNVIYNMSQNISSAAGGTSI